MILEGVVVAPRWSVASGFVVVVVVWLFGLEFLSQAEAILHLMLGVLVERAQAIEDLLVLLVIVALGARFVNSGDDMIWSAAAILTRFGSFWPITATVPMVTAVVVAVVAMAPDFEAIIATASWALSAYILVEAYFGLFGIGVLIDGHNHLVNPLRWLAIELAVEVTVIESSDEGGDDLYFRDVGNRIPHLGKTSDVAT